MASTQELFSVAGRTALVTGGSAGIGEMIATGYVEAGAKVYIASRKLDQCEKVAERLSAGGVCIPLEANLSSEEGCRELARRVTEAEGQIDILVNNAGATWGAPLDEFPASAWDRVLDLNVKGLFFLTQSLLPALEAAGSQDRPARVINIASVDGVKVPDLENYSYSASKAAVMHMTKVLAKKLAERHITVNAILPGPFPSRMMAKVLEDMGDEIAAMAPMKRIGCPEDVIAASIYLASPGASWMTGVLLPVDGGISTTL